jgi:hypothetical protein
MLALHDTLQVSTIFVTSFVTSFVAALLALHDALQVSTCLGLLSIVTSLLALHDTRQVSSSEIDYGQIWPSGPILPKNGHKY